MIIGLDAGGTEIKAGIVSKNRIIKKAVVRTGKTKKEVIKNIIGIIDMLFDSKIKAIGIGIPGPADYEKGVIGRTPNIPLKGVNLKNIVGNRFKKKVVMMNDANCFVLGESIRLKKKNVAGLTLGTGVGGGIVIDGRIYTGNGNAGELGHCTINLDGIKSRCGNNGCLEEHISVRAIRRKYGKGPIKLKSKAAWNEIGRFLGIGISNIANSLDPGVVVIGGGISNSFSLFKGAMNKEIKKRSLNKVKVVKGAKDSGILGAAAYAGLGL